MYQETLNKVIAIIVDELGIDRTSVNENSKIVADLDVAAKRVRSLTAPANCVRLNCGTPCTETGVCVSVNAEPGKGCNSDRRICCNYVVSGKQRIKDRIKVILVGEPVGY